MQESVLGNSNILTDIMLRLKISKNIGAQEKLRYSNIKCEVFLLSFKDIFLNSDPIIH